MWKGADVLHLVSYCPRTFWEENHGIFSQNIKYSGSRFVEIGNVLDGNEKNVLRKRRFVKLRLLS